MLGGGPAQERLGGNRVQLSREPSLASGGFGQLGPEQGAWWEEASLHPPPQGPGMGGRPWGVWKGHPQAQRAGRLTLLAEGNLRPRTLASLGRARAGWEHGGPRP